MKQGGFAVSDRFAAMAKQASALAGSYLTFMVAVGLVLIWAVSGPFFGFSTTWQLVINTSTTIVTFLMVFLIQNTQNRDSEALHLKIDELINAISDADDSVMEAEDDTDRELKELKAKYHQLAKTKGVSRNGA
jgi:low affinity Fe/Cu permease